MLEARHIVGLAVAASIAGHLVMTLGLVFGGAHAIGVSGTLPIAVDLVPSNEAMQDVREDTKPPVPLPPQPAAQAPVSKTSPETSADAQKPGAPSQPDYLSDVTAQQPDIATRYGVMMGLRDIAVTDAGGRAETAASVSSLDIAAFRRHLRSCAKLPASVAASDRVHIVLRVSFTTDSKLAAPPALVEASASTKGPALMKSAVAALLACQPYAMLPADKYQEWKVLDLKFTPDDFSGA